MLKIRRKKLMNTKKQSVYLIALFFVAVFMGVGYSYLSSTLSVKGYTTVYKNNWDVHFENLEVTTGSVNSGTSSIAENSTIVNYQVPLESIGDYYEFTVDVVNNGSIDAMIGSVVNSGITSAQQAYIDYSLAYTSDRTIQEKDLLPAGSREKLLVKVKYKDNLPSSILPTTDQTLNLSFNVNYIEAHNQVEVKHPICKRAKKLHQEICNTRFSDNQTANNCIGDGYSIGQKITYGSLGTSGTLTRGDAFDCDVNGDKKYDSETERFYYVTSLDSNNDYGVLIYYNNTLNGEPKGFNYTSSYDTSNQPQVKGPISLIQHLPTTSQWKNVQLSNSNRKIKDENGIEYINFSYSGYATRLLTTQELEQGCNKSFSQIYRSTSDNDGVLSNNCLYILENSQYVKEPDGTTDRVPITFENVYSGNTTDVFYISGWSRAVYNISANSTWLAARPVIEVPKDKINY